MEQDSREKRAEFLRKIDSIEHNIELENKKLRKISSAEEYLAILKENVDKCSELLSKSLEPGHERVKFNNLVMEGEKNYTKAVDSFQEHFNVVKKRVDNLNNERENIILEYEKNAGNRKLDDTVI